MASKEASEARRIESLGLMKSLNGLVTSPGIESDPDMESIPDVKSEHEIYSEPDINCVPGLDSDPMRGFNAFNNKNKNNPSGSESGPSIGELQILKQTESLAHFGMYRLLQVLLPGGEGTISMRDISRWTKTSRTTIKGYLANLDNFGFINMSRGQSGWTEISIPDIDSDPGIESEPGLESGPVGEWLKLIYYSLLRVGIPPETVDSLLVHRSTEIAKEKGIDWTVLFLMEFMSGAEKPTGKLIWAWREYGKEWDPPIKNDLASFYKEVDILTMPLDKITDKGLQREAVEAMDMYGISRPGSSKIRENHERSIQKLREFISYYTT